MSGSLLYRLPTKGHHVNCAPAFRDAIGKRGRLTAADIAYLEGWRDAGNAKAATKLIDLIYEHDEIEVWVDY